MPRARNLKPSFFTNEQLAACSDGARLLFAGLWTLADREGRLENRPLRIKAELFPYENRDVGAMLAELHQADLVKLYCVSERDCIWIPSFVKHQKPHWSEKASDLPSYEEFRSAPENSRALALNVECGMLNVECGMRNGLHPPAAGTDPAVDLASGLRDATHSPETDPNPRDLLDEAGCPSELATPAVRDAIREFNEFRREKRWGVMSARSWSKVWKSFTGYTPSDFVAAVDASIAAGWRGIFPPKGAPSGRPGKILNGPGQTHDADRGGGFGEL